MSETKRDYHTGGGMRTIPDWVVRLLGWPIGVVGEFLGTRTDRDPQARAARRWLRQLLMTRAEQLATLGLLMDKGVFTREEYEIALQRAAQTLCQELQDQFPGIVANDYGVTVSRDAMETMKDWPR